MADVKINDNEGESYWTKSIDRNCEVIDTFSPQSPHSRRGNSIEEIKAAAQDN